MPTRDRAQVNACPSRLRGDVGGAVVEFALIMPVLVALLVGMLTTGLALNEQIQLTHAAREAARYGSTVPASTTFASGGWATNVERVLLERSAGELQVAGATWCVALVEGSPARVVEADLGQFSTAGAAACDPSETYPVTEDDVGRRVQVRADRPSLIGIVFAEWQITVSTEATAKLEADG